MDKDAVQYIDGRLKAGCESFHHVPGTFQYDIQALVKGNYPLGFIRLVGATLYQMEGTFEVFTIIAPLVGKCNEGIIHARVNTHVHVPDKFAKVTNQRAV